MQTMSPLDASFLHIEDAVTHMHIGSVGLFEGPPPAPGEVKQAVAAQAARLLAAAAPAMRRAGLTAVVDVDPQSL